MSYPVAFVCAVALAVAACSATLAAQFKVEATDFSQKTIYHSPETPGYTSWCGLWQLPNGWLRADFTQITGPKDKPVGSDPILQSTDSGATWKQISNKPTKIVLNGGILWEAREACRGMVVLPDGTLVRSIQAPVEESASGYVERSKDGGKTWGSPIYPLPVRDYRVWPTLIRRLLDGRLVLFGGVWKRGEGEMLQNLVKTMFVSADNGKTWGKPIVVMPSDVGKCEESDFCELPNGDLFWVHRAVHYNSEPLQTRMQSIVYKKGNDFVAGECVESQLPHSGYPMVMYAREGIVLHFATDGVNWTSDLGKTWTRLDIPGTPYYPKALQLKDGKIVLVGHVGSDDVYGTIDQSIVYQEFRLKVTRTEN